MNQNQQFPLKYQGAQLHQPDINSLNPKQWLTAEAIYFGILFNSSNQCQELKVMDPSLATLLLFENDFEDLLPIKDEIANKEYIITAINDSQGGTGSHWGSLLFHNFQFYLFDSGSSQQLYENSQDIAKKITSILKNDESILSSKINVQRVENVPHQNNNYDCGVYAIAICSELIKQINDKKPWNFENITPQTVAALRVTLRVALQKL